MFHNQHALKNVYVSLIRSQLDYATLIWSPVNNNKCQTLEANSKFIFKIYVFKILYTNTISFFV
jgi:hypothetical protein